MMKQLLFRGMATALVTPMHPDGSVDLQTLARLTEWQIQSGAAALVPCGTTGEAATLTLQERTTVIRTVAGTASGRVPVIAGAGCNDTARALENCKAAAAAGADALLLVTPYYNKCTQRDWLPTILGWHPLRTCRSSCITYPPVPASPLIWKAAGRLRKSITSSV